jgi:hypothetical protein
MIANRCGMSGCTKCTGVDVANRLKTLDGTRSRGERVVQLTCDPWDNPSGDNFITDPNPRAAIPVTGCVVKVSELRTVRSMGERFESRLVRSAGLISAFI